MPPIELIGKFAWLLQEQDPVAYPRSLVLLLLYVLAVLLVLVGLRRTFLGLTRRHWLMIALLAVATIILSNVLLVRLNSSDFSPMPINSASALSAPAPQQAQLPATPLLGVVPVLLAAYWFGIGPAFLLSVIGGFWQAVFQGGEITQHFEILWLGLGASYVIRQNYRGNFAKVLRQPIVAGPLVALVTWPIMFLSFFVSALDSASALAAFNYAWPLCLALFVPILAEGVLSGIVAQGLMALLPARQLPLPAQSAPPWARGLNRRMMFAFIPFTAVLTIVLLYAVSATALSEAKRQSIEQMSRDALSAAREVPSFFQTGQGLIREFATDDRLRSPDPAARQTRLAGDLRTGPFFDQLLLFNADGVQNDAYPPAENQNITVEERQLISHTLQTHAPQMSSVYAYNQQPLISFVAVIEDPASGRALGVLMGRARLQLNPIIVRLRDGLQNTLGAGVGFLVDENKQIVVHPNPDKVLKTWSHDPTLLPTSTTPQGGAAYDDRFPDATPRLLFVQPAAGTDWLVVIELPFINVLQLAVQISTPLFLILLGVGLLAGLGLLLLTRAITRPIQDLSGAAVQIARGQLEQPITLSGEDEVGQLGSAFEQMRLSLKDRLDDLSLLLRVSEAVSASLDLERGVPPLLAGAMQASLAHVARLVLLSDDGVPEMVLTHESLATLTPLDKALATLAVQSETPILIENVVRARSRALIDPALIGPGVRAIAAVPVRRQTRPLGMMWLGYAEPRSFTQSEVNVLGTLAGQAAVFIENARLFQAAEGGRRRLQAVLNSTSDAVIVTDQTTRVLLCNPATEVAFGLAPGASMGRLISELWPKSAMERLLNADENAATRTEEIMLPDGRTLYGSASAIISGDGQAIGRVAVLRDITYLKELDAMKSEFVATVSHDLRAPLTYMRGYATMLPMVGSLSTKQQDYAEKIMAGIEQMTELIDDLLDLGRIEAGVGMVREDAALADIIRTVVEAQAGQAMAHGLSLKTGYLSERTIQSDPGLMRHAVTNLIDNAIKYTPSGGSILVEVEERDDCMVVVVADTGIGIAPADQARLFERFYRVKRRETIDIKGTGLGLAIVKSIAQWHGGRVWVESQLGSGSTFYFLVPLNA